MKDMEVSQEKNGERTGLGEFLSRYEQVVIPDIQRDYCLGSDEEKLTKLLDHMAGKRWGAFDFGCMVGYEHDKVFYVYDGQQRLATLVYLCGYLLRNDMFQAGSQERSRRAQNLKKFCFPGREEANRKLESLLSSVSDGEIVDFTTWSVDRLLKTFKAKRYGGRLDFDYLYNRVRFQLVTVDRADDAEQFFLDLNDGLLLEDYEITKARLVHHGRGLEDFPEFEDFALALDNRWLVFFKRVRGLAKGMEAVCEEELEMRFLEFCLKMMWIEEKGSVAGWNKDEVGWIGGDHMRRLYRIMNQVVSRQLTEDSESGRPVNYSFDNKGEYGECLQCGLYAGAYWNLADENYDHMLKTMMMSLVGKNDKAAGEFTADPVVWAFISNLEADRKERNQYLRFLKKVLNHNRMVRKEAFYTRGRDIVYTKYSVYGIPQYYFGERRRAGQELWRFDSWRPEKEESKKEYVYRVVSLNRGFEGRFCPQSLLAELRGGTQADREIGTLIRQEKSIREGSWKEEIERLENLPYVNGLAEGLLGDDGQPCVTYGRLTEAFDPKNRDYEKMEDRLFQFYRQWGGLLAEKYPSLAENSEFYLKVEMKWFTYRDSRKNGEWQDSGLYDCVILPRTWCDFLTEPGRNVGELFGEAEPGGGKGRSPLAEYIRNYRRDLGNHRGGLCRSWVMDRGGEGIFWYCMPYRIPDKNSWLSDSGNYASASSNWYSLIQEKDFRDPLPPSKNL